MQSNDDGPTASCMCDCMRRMGGVVVYIIRIHHTGNLKISRQNRHLPYWSACETRCCASTTVRRIMGVLLLLLCVLLGACAASMHVTNP